MANIRISLATDVKGALPVANVDVGNGTWNFATLQVGGAAVATQAYADALKAGLTVKPQVDAALTTNLTLAGDSQTIDGIAATAGKRIGAFGQTNATQNGVYVVASGSWTRAADFDADADVTAGALIPVAPGGTDNGGKFYLMLTDDPEIGTDNISFALFPSASSGPSAGTGGEIVAIAPDNSVAAGTSANFAPADHVHDVTTGAAADLSESTSSSGAGSANSLAKSDHVHAFPNLGKEGASSLLANVRRRDAELSVLPSANGAVVQPIEGSFGFAVTAEGSPAMSVRVAAGTGYGGTDYNRNTVPAGNQQVTLSAADATFPRYDAIVIPSTGGNATPTKREGTPGGSPALPSLSSGDVLIAVVKVVANDTAISAEEIFDHRRCANPRPRSESFTMNGSTPYCRLARRVFGGVSVFRDGLRMEDGADSDVSHYQISEPIEGNGTLITFGADPASDTVVRVDYLG